MTVFRVQMPDGRVARIDAASADEAMAFAKNGLKPTARQQDFAGELTKARKETAVRQGAEGSGPMGFFNSLTSQPALPILDEINAGAHALGNEAWNQTYRRMTGARPVDSGAIYDARMAADAEYDAGHHQRHPGGDLAGGLLTGLTAGGPAAGVTAQAVKGAGLLPRAVATAKAAGIGGAYGTAYGGATGQGSERLDNAVQGFEGGATMGGLLEGVATPALKLAAPVAKDIAQGVRSALKGKPAAALGPVFPNDAERRAAGLAAAQLAAKKGITSANVGDLAARYAGKDPMAAEVIGPEAVTQLAATARRGGDTGAQVRTKAYLRNQAAPERIKRDFEDTLGVAPEFAAGDVESMVERGRRDAGPLYDAALGSPDGVWNSELERLASLPHVQRALAGAETSERIAQRGASGLTYGRVEVPHPGEGSPPPGTPGEIPPVVPRRGPATAPTRGPSLLTWIARNGGINDAEGELAHMGADTWHVGKPYRARAIGGQEADDLAQRAWEAGYFPEHAERPGTNDLYDAIRHELAGRPRYARQPDPAAADRFAGRQADEEAIYRGHTGDEPPSGEDYQGSPAPHYEPGQMQAPTAATWDKVKKHIGNMIERDPVTNRVIATGPTGQRNRDLSTLAAHLTDALAGDAGRPGAIPGYRAALDAGGDAPRLQSAFDRAKGRLTNGTVRDFGKLWQSYKTPAEKQAAQGALASDIMDLWGRGQLKGGKFAIPGIQQKLELAFGPAKAKTFIARMEAEAELAASGNRVAPYSGSPTMALGEAASEQDRAAQFHLGDLQRIGGKFAGGNWGGGVADAMGTGVAKLAARGRTAGMTEGMRNEYGRILQMSPDDFAGFLGEWEKLPEATKKLFPLPAGITAGNLSGQGVADERRRAPY